MSDSKEKTFLSEIKDFINSSKTFLYNCEKPDKKGNIIL